MICPWARSAKIADILVQARGQVVKISRFACGLSHRIGSSAMSTSETVRKHKEYLFPAVSMYYQEPMALARGEGAYVWDDQGNRYLDCFGGVLTVSVGHGNPKVVEAVVNQVKQISHTSTLYASKPQSDLAEKLAKLAPGKLSKSFFSNSGTEANETAVAAAK